MFSQPLCFSTVSAEKVQSVDTAKKLDVSPIARSCLCSLIEKSRSRGATRYARLSPSRPAFFYLAAQKHDLVENRNSRFSALALEKRLVSAVSTEYTILSLTIQCQKTHYYLEPR